MGRSTTGCSLPRNKLSYFVLRSRTLAAAPEGVVLGCDSACYGQADARFV